MTSLGATTWREAALFAPSGVTLLVPVGSTEQHGPHLPLTTDTEIVDAVVAGAIERDVRLVGAPGGLRVERRAPGLRRDPLDRERGHRAAPRRARSLGIAHLRAGRLRLDPRGQQDALRRALDAFGEDGGAHVTSWSPRWSGDLHAGRTETSLMLAIAPERVHLEQAQAGPLEPAETLLPRLRKVGVRAVSENGVLGDPSGASATEGRELLERAVDELVAFVESNTANENQPADERTER